MKLEWRGGSVATDCGVIRLDRDEGSFRLADTPASRSRKTTIVAALDRLPNARPSSTNRLVFAADHYSPEPHSATSIMTRSHTSVGTLQRVCWPRVRNEMMPNLSNRLSVSIKLAFGRPDIRDSSETDCGLEFWISESSSMLRLERSLDNSSSEPPFWLGKPSRATDCVVLAPQISPSGITATCNVFERTIPPEPFRLKRHPNDKRPIHISTNDTL